MVVPSHVVVVELHQGLDRLLHRRHLDQGHLMVPAGGEDALQGQLHRRRQTHLRRDIGPKELHRERSFLLEELEALDGSSAVGEQQTEVVLPDGVPGHPERSHETSQSMKREHSLHSVAAGRLHCCVSWLPDVGEVKR